jgi:Uma2 family endonuclease
MSVLIAQPGRGKGVEVSLRRITVDEYHRMIRDGYFAQNERFELINGWIIEKMPKNPPHSTAVTRLRQLLDDQLPRDEFTVRVQEPITLAGSDSETEPDIVVARGPLATYATKHPAPDDVLLVMEVADSTLDLDQGPKLEIYAGSGLDPYVVLDIPHRAVLLYRTPQNGSYQPPQAFTGNQEVLLSFNGHTVRFTADELFASLP